MRRNARNANAANAGPATENQETETVVSAAGQDALVDPADIHSSAKLCLEATLNAPCATPPLRGELGGLGVGLRTLLVAVPIANCTALASLAISSGCFPPLKWEVCASRKENKPLSLSVVPGDGGLADCIGACFHTDWLWPAELYSDRKELVIPLFAKLAAVYIYATEEKEIMNEFSFADMGTFAGTSTGSATSGNSRKKWKFTGLSYGGCVATVCSLLMPAQFVASLVTFGSPPTFSVIDSTLMPFASSHLQHTYDLMPHLFNRSAAARIAARLTGLGFLVPDPPLSLPNVSGKLNKRGDPIDLYRHDLAHVMILTPSQAQVSLGAALKKQEAQLARLNNSANSPDGYTSGDGSPVAVERLPLGNTTALLVATSTLFDRRHGPVPDVIAKMMPRQQIYVMPKLDASGKPSPFDLRMQSPRLGIRDYFLPLRVMLGKRIDLTPVSPADGAQFLGQFLNNLGECATKRLAADVLNLTTATSTVPPNVNNLTAAQVSFAEYVALSGYKALQMVHQAERGMDPSMIDAVEGGAGFKRNGVVAKVPVSTVAQNPPLAIGTMLELISDTTEGLRALLTQLKPAAAWDVDKVSRQLAAWSGGLPVASMVATAFISTQWLVVACSPPIHKVPLSRHVATAAIVDGMASSVRDVLDSPDGHHFEWSVSIAGVTHGVGKSTLIHLLTRELVQSRFGPNDELTESNRPTPARRGGAQEAVLRMKWSWAATADTGPSTDGKGGKAGFGFRVSIGEDGAYDYQGNPGDKEGKEGKKLPKKAGAKGATRGRSGSPPVGDRNGTKGPAGSTAAPVRSKSKEKKEKKDKAAPPPPAGPVAPEDQKLKSPLEPDAPTDLNAAAQDDAPIDEEEAARLLKMTDDAKKLILPPSILLRLHLDEVHFDGSFGTVKRLGRYAQVLWIVTDRFTVDRLALMAPKLHDAFCSYQQHAILYCPRRPPSSVRPPPGAPQATQPDDNVISILVEDAERVYVETVIRRLQREYHLRVAHIDVNPGALSSMQMLLAASQTMLSLQRLLMQWMVPRLPIPVDPHAVPRGVDIGALFTRCDAVVEDYLRTSTDCHLMGNKAQKAFLMQQALFRSQAMGVAGRRRGTLGLTQYSVQSYDDVERGVKVIAAPTVIENEDNDSNPPAGVETPPA